MRLELHGACELQRRAVVEAAAGPPAAVAGGGREAPVRACRYVCQGWVGGMSARVSGGALLFNSCQSERDGVNPGGLENL